jgi:hypothetical protein
MNLSRTDFSQQLPRKITTKVVGGKFPFSSTIFGVKKIHWKFPGIIPQKKMYEKSAPDLADVGT